MTSHESSATGTPVVEAADGKLEVDVSASAARPVVDEKSIDRNAVGQVLPEGTRAMGMMFLLLSLGMLFASMLVGYAFFRFTAPEWPPPDTPEAPFTIWLSTASIIICSAGMHWAVVSARGRRTVSVKRAALLALIAGLGFVGLQAYNWVEMIGLEVYTNNRFGFFFYFLTALHAAHVLGGLIPLGMLNRSLAVSKFDVEAVSHRNRLGILATYWHFIDVVWLVIVAALVF